MHPEAAASTEASSHSYAGRRRLPWALALLLALTARAAAADCHPSYEGVCVPDDVEDVDCADGEGNGPYYVRGPIHVVGPDEYELDRDGDGIACEPKKDKRR
jgi:hypothetical protein